MNPASPESADMEMQFRERFLQRTEGLALVVGSKIWPGRPDWREWLPDAWGVDMIDGDGVDIVHDFEHGPVLKHSTFWHVECLSVLEHTQRPWIVAANIEDSMHDGASIFLSVPWVWRFHGYPHDYWRFSHLTLPIIFPRIDWRDVRYVGGTKFRKSPRMTEDEGGSLAKMQVMGWGVKR